MPKFQWGNIVGVILTGLLLTFGAPFWCERLRDMKVLQDALRPRKADEPKVPAEGARGT